MRSPAAASGSWPSSPHPPRSLPPSPPCRHVARRGLLQRRITQPAKMGWGGVGCYSCGVGRVERPASCNWLRVGAGLGRVHPR
jgi:hypothetical protein